MAHAQPAARPRPLSGAYADRFIPSRAGSGDLQSAFSLLRSSTAHNSATAAGATSASAATGRDCYEFLLRSELLDATGVAIAGTPPRTSTTTDASASRPTGLEGLKRVAPGDISAPPPDAVSSRPGSLFRFQAERARPMSAPAQGVGDDASTLEQTRLLSLVQPTAHGGVGMSDEFLRNALLNVNMNAGRTVRKIARAPFKVLDAPCLKDDFYLNLVDWSSQNVLAVGLGSCVYLWSACTSVVTKLCDLKFGGPVCSVSWNQSGTLLAVGTMAGIVQVWDTGSCKLLRTMTGHSGRVGCLAWSSSLLSSGSRDFDVFNRDLRAREPYIARLSSHRQEVCGLRWSPDDTQLASGGNDNKLLIWSAYGGRNSRVGGNSFWAPMMRFGAHEAAVKAIAWSPHARGLLASGGGTQCKKIRFWNTMTGADLSCVDTGSQVCNLAWSKNVNEIVSTHGYSQNQIIVWKYPSLSKVVTLTGHSLRVLYLAVSPSGETIVTGAGDETLRFWNVFPQAKSKRGSADSVSLLSPRRMHIR